MKGRVSRPDLILECNNLIRLNPSGKVFFFLSSILITFKLGFKINF